MKHPLYGHNDSTFVAIGKEKGLKKLVDDFYDVMDTLDEAKTIRAMHPDDLTLSRDKLFCFLSGWMGGPKYYQQKYGSISIPGSHSQFFISEVEKDIWLLCMQKALDKNNIAEELKEYLIAQLTIPANRIVMTSKASIRKKP